MLTSISASLRAAISARGKNLPRYIVVEGPIGVGKTTLTRQIAELLSYQILLESPADNPFLSRFYSNRRQGALPTQLFFLLRRTQQISEIPKNDLVGPTLITDFLIEKDRIFAEINLNEDELTLYNQISEAIYKKGPVPDLVIYLQASVPVLRKRIQARGIDFEQSIETKYLEELVEKYTEFFHQYDETPLLIINAESIDLAGNELHFLSLINQIMTNIPDKIQ